MDHPSALFPSELNLNGAFQMLNSSYFYIEIITFISGR